MVARSESKPPYRLYYYRYGVRMDLAADSLDDLFASAAFINDFGHGSVDEVVDADGQVVYAYEALITRLGEYSDAKETRR